MTRILRNGVAVSELGPGAGSHKWTPIARNRIVAALARAAVVVQGRSRSGSLSTVAFAREARSPDRSSTWFGAGLAV